MDLTGEKQYQVWVIIALIALAFFLTYYFQVVLESRQLYTHFFYIPIVLSCIWWKKKGLYVTATLLAILILGQVLFFQREIEADDFVRAFMIALVSLVTVFLSEALAGAKSQLQASETRYRKIFETTGTAMAILEEDTTLSLVNSEFEALSGYSKNEIEHQKSWMDFIADTDRARIRSYHDTRRIAPDRAPKTYAFTFLTRNHVQRDILATVDMIPGTRQSIASLSDITVLKQSLKRQQELQVELSTALAKALSGFIPICANCKKIRDDQDAWVPIESFLSGKTEAAFSHGICPQCAKVLYAEFLPDEQEPVL